MASSLILAGHPGPLRGQGRELLSCSSTAADSAPGSPPAPAVTRVGTMPNILARLEVTQAPGDMDLPGFRLHPLSGDRSGTWAVTVRTNWRVTFRFDGEDVADVKYEDYH